MNPTETFLVILLAGLATAIALGAVEITPAILHSSVAQAFLLVMTLVLFAYSPVVGIAAVALFAILMFKRNVQKTTQYAKVTQQFVRESTEQQKYQGAAPYASVPPSKAPTTVPRNYTTDYDAQGNVEGYASPEEVGTYALGEPRPSAMASQSFQAMYRPTEDMGDNTFVADQAAPLENYKTQSFAY